MATFSLQRHFCIYPDAVTTVPDSTTTGAVWFDQDPIYGGQYDPSYQMDLRGSVTETLGWRFTQIFPYVENGVQKSRYRRKILVRDDSFSLARVTVNSLAALAVSAGTIYRFYDGENIFRVWFSVDPVGFKYHKSLPPWWEGRMLSNPPGNDYLYYNYEIILDVLEVKATSEGLT